MMCTIEGADTGMKATTIFIILLMAIPAMGADSTTYKSPWEILQIFKKSPRLYILDVKNEDDTVSFAKEYRRLGPGFKIVGGGGDRNYEEYKLSDFESALFQKAETAFGREDWQIAKQFYEKLLSVKQDFSPAMTYIGQCYEQLKDNENAKKYYKKAIRINFGDYSAHWFLASLLAEENDEGWLDEMVTAHILNRNNPLIIQELKTQLDSKGMQYKGWQYDSYWNIDEVADTIKLSGTTYYMPFALCRAYQRYEVGLLTDSTQWTDYYSLTKECLLDTYDMYLGIKEKAKTDSTEFTKLEVFEVMGETLTDKSFDQYVYYEFFLRQYPLMSYTLRDEYFLDLIDYFKKYHIEKSS